MGEPEEEQKVTWALLKNLSPNDIKVSPNFCELNPTTFLGEEDEEDKEIFSILDHRHHGKQSGLNVSQPIIRNEEVHLAEKPGNNISSSKFLV